MKRAHHHLLPKIELVRPCALRARIERAGLAVRGPREPLQVLHQRPADALGALFLVGHEVVDVEVKSLEGVLADAVYGDAEHGTAFRRDAHARASGEHAPHLALVIGGQRRPELAVHAFRPLQPPVLDDPARVIGDVDDVHGLISPSLRNISLMPRIAWRDRASFSMSAMRTWSSP